MLQVAQLAIEKLLCYGIKKELIQPIDKMYCRNLLLDLLHISSPAEDFDANNYVPPEMPFEILDILLDYAQQQGIISDSITERDLLDTRIMNTLTPLPSFVLDKFNSIANSISKKAATDWYYSFCKSTNYIRQERIAKNIIWEHKTEKYGALEITINLSKPEKDPKEIAKLKDVKKSGYPSCLLCAENMGYAGNLNHPARQNHRILPITLNNEQWYFQYSPYIYFNEHTIALRGEHVPMNINRDTFVRLLDFTSEIPHYFMGSNAGLPIVGGSILSHDHYQGGGHEMPMAKAPIYKNYEIANFPDVKAGLVAWPMTCIRLQCSSLNTLADAAEYVLESWQGYSDDKRFVFAYTNDEMHNAITPIARNRGNYYEIDLVLRNNITTEELPMGVYHPHPHLHHIKKENIGLIEVMGVFILPGRLKHEIDLVKRILKGENISASDYPELEKHMHWVNKMKKENSLPLIENDADQLLKQEIGRICLEVLGCAAVFKDTEDGRKGAEKFMESCGFISA